MTKTRRDIRADAANAIQKLKPTLKKSLAELDLNREILKKSMFGNRFCGYRGSMIYGSWLGQTLQTRNTLYAISKKGLPLEDDKFLASLNFAQMINYGDQEGEYDPPILDFLKLHSDEIFGAMHRVLCPDPSDKIMSRVAYNNIPRLGLNASLSKAALRISDYKAARAQTAEEKLLDEKKLGKKDVAAFKARYEKFRWAFPNVNPYLKTSPAFAKKIAKLGKSGDIKKDAAMVINKIIPKMAQALEKRNVSIQKALACVNQGTAIPATIVNDFWFFSYVEENHLIYDILQCIVQDEWKRDAASLWYNLICMINHGTKKEPEFLPIVTAFVNAYPAELYQLLYRLELSSRRTRAQKITKHHIINTMIGNDAVAKAGAKFRKKEFGFDPLVKKTR